MPATRLARPTLSSRLVAIVELRDQRLQPRHVRRFQLPALGEMADEGRQFAAEHAVEEALALGGDVRLARDQRPIAAATALAKRFQRLLLQQPPDERLYRGVAPALGGGDVGNDVLH